MSAWIATYTGVQWNLLSPQVEDVRIEDIAHALSQICRYGGHSKCFYSVGEHSVRCASLVAEWDPTNYELQLQTLLHDGSEAYIGDMVRPLKETMPNFRAVEDKTMSVIRRALGLGPLFGADEMTVKKADEILLMTERRDLIAHQDISWSTWTSAEADPSIHIGGWSPASAKRIFLTAYKGLRGKLSNDFKSQQWVCHCNPPKPMPWGCCYCPDCQP